MDAYSTLKLIKFIIIFVLLSSETNSLFTSGAAEEEVIVCKQKEREALLTFTQGLTALGNDYDSLSTWGREDSKKECCNWEGVLCSNRNGHVIGLDLYDLRGEISPALLELRHLNSLELGGNDFEGRKIPEFIGSLVKLQHLALYRNNFSGDVPSHLGNLTSLRELDLSFNDLTSKDLSWLSNLTSLSKLDLSWNRFKGPFPLLSNLTLLSTLDFSSNQFEGPLPDLKAFSLLIKLYLENNKLTKLPTSIGLLSNLELLDVSYNSLEGTISDVHFLNLYNLTHLDLSFNSLALNFTPHWIPPFQLNHLYLARNNIGPRFPAWLETQMSFRHLDISSCGISGEVPSWFWNRRSPYVDLNMSYNSMSGSIPDLSSNFFDSASIDISSNKFSGPLPLFHPNSSVIFLSDNMFNGSIQSICRVKYELLGILVLSKNQLSGELPNCWENMTGLYVLNIDNNQFSGQLPHSLGSLTQLRALQFRNNNLTGEFPPTLMNCKDLVLIDAGRNGLTGNIPMGIWTLANLSILSLRQNNFHGSIPPEICRLRTVQVLDLSENNLSGRIPRCFNDITLLRNKSIGDVETRSTIKFGTFVFNVIVQWKRQESEYSTLGLLKLIDLSSNKLVGNIPQEVSFLVQLVSLNLSRNSLTGNISSEIGQMEMLESLDLSRNQLSGEIPAGLAKLNYLSVLDLSSNNLSGKIPQSTQLQSFDASAYAENTDLCGKPLPSCPGDYPTLPPAATQGNQGNIDEEQKGEGLNLIKSLSDEYFISVVLGFIVGFWGLVGPLLLKRSWRDDYYGFLRKIGDWLYVSVTHCSTRLIRCIMFRK